MVSGSCGAKPWRTGYLEHLNETKEVTRKLTGRGRVTIVEKEPERRKLAGGIEEIRKGDSKQAIKYLKQARRCEQVAYRMELINLQPEGPKVKSYIDLNLQALKKIHELAEEKDGWGNDVRERLSNNEERSKQAEDIMKLPWMKRIAVKYYDEK